MKCCRRSMGMKLLAQQLSTFGLNSYLTGKNTWRMNQGLGAPKCGRTAKNIEEWQKLVMEYRQSTVKIISEAFGISTGIVNLILNDNQQLHKEEDTGAVDQW